MAERVLYRHAVEALFQRTLGQKLTPRAKTRLKEVGLDVANFGPEVPQPIWAKALRIACEEVYPHKKLEDAAFQLGCALANGYVHTTMGKAAAAMARLLGPNRMMPRLTSNLRGANNFIETTPKQTSPTSWEIWVNEHHGLPTYIAGGLFIVVPISGAKNVRVKVMASDAQTATYLVEWDA
jgi:uncharacterized protein (TIGR02265 family)